MIPPVEETGYVFQISAGLVLVSSAVLIAMYLNKMWKTRLHKIRLEDEHERLRQHRAQLQFHIDWAAERGDHAESKELLNERHSLDRKLASLQREYDILSSGKVKA